MKSATLTLTREQAIKFANINEDSRPYRIIEGLEKCGFTNVQKFGRGKNTLFVCEQSDKEDEQCYYMFKDICINEYGYDKCFNYDKALDVIEYHITNDGFKTLEDISSELMMSPVTLRKHRKRLCGTILKNKEECKKRTYGFNYTTNDVDDITILYNDTIMVVYNRMIKYIYEHCKLTYKTRVSLLTNKKDCTFEMIDESIEGFSTIRKTMLDSGYKDIASYPVWWNISSDKSKINPHLTQKLFQLILRENGYDYVFFLRLYEITEDLKHDKELLNIISKAILFKNKDCK